MQVNGKDWEQGRETRHARRKGRPKVKLRRRGSVTVMMGGKDEEQR